MTKIEIINNIKQLEGKLIIIDKYLSTLPDEDVKQTKEYKTMKMMVYRLNALYSALENCV